MIPKPVPTSNGRNLRVTLEVMTHTSLGWTYRILLVLAILYVVYITFRVSRTHVVKPVEISQHAATGEIVQVIRVVDGDTIEVTGGRRVRYIGMDTPEITECYGEPARDENARLVYRKIVRLVSDVSDTDTYGRLLRYVYVGNTFVNDALVRNGFARIEPILPDTYFADQFLLAQTHAENQHIGLWAACQ